MMGLVTRMRGANNAVVEYSHDSRPTGTHSEGKAEMPNRFICIPHSDVGKHVIVIQMPTVDEGIQCLPLVSRLGCRPSDCQGLALFSSNQNVATRHCKQPRNKLLRTNKGCTRTQTASSLYARQCRQSLALHGDMQRTHRAAVRPCLLHVHSERRGRACLWWSPHMLPAHW